MKSSDRLKLAGILLGAFAVFFCVEMAASAATGTAAVSGTAPTTYVDGTALPASAIAGYDLDCQFTPTGGTAAACTSSPTTITGSALAASVTITYPVVGGKACFRARAKAGTVVGDWSTVGANSCKDLPAVAPSAPGALTITVTLTLNLKSDTPITVAMQPPVITEESKP